MLIALRVSFDLLQIEEEAAVAINDEDKRRNF
jgi:hypothetical protein